MLVVSNETVGGHKVLEALEQRATRGPIRVTVVCPRSTPRQGFVIYDDTVRSAARVRLDLLLGRLRELGIPAHGEVMDPDPYQATQDAVREWGADEIIVSTYPYPRSGMLRRDLVERIEKWSGVPVQHVVVDLRHEPVRHVLVVASQTVGGWRGHGRRTGMVGQSSNGALSAPNGQDAGSASRNAAIAAVDAAVRTWFQRVQLDA